MRAAVLLVPALVAGAFAAPPSRAAVGEIVVVVSRPGVVDVTLDRPFVPAVSTANYTKIPEPGYAGFVAEPLGDTSGRHSFAMVSVRWASGSQTNIRHNRQARRGELGPTETLPPAPAGRWRFHLFGDSTVMLRIPAPELGRSVVVRPAGARLKSTGQVTQLHDAAGTVRTPFEIGPKRSTVLVGITTHRGPGATYSASCIAAAGGACRPDNTNLGAGQAGGAESWSTSTLVTRPGELPAGRYEVIGAAATALPADQQAIVVVVETPR